jgi:hypothetical protein
MLPLWLRRRLIPASVLKRFLGSSLQQKLVNELLKTFKQLNYKTLVPDIRKIKYRAAKKRIYKQTSKVNKQLLLFLPTLGEAL